MRSRSSTCTSRCTPRSSVPAASRSELQIRTTLGMHLPGGSTGSRRTGSTRKRRNSSAASPRTTPQDMAWLRQRSCSTGSGRPRTPPSSSSRLRFDLAAAEVYVFSAPRRRERRCRRARPRWTSLTPSTPRSGTGPSAGGSIGRGKQALESTSTTTTRWRSSPPRRPRRDRAGTGSSSCRAPGRATRSGSGSPRSAGKPRWRRARIRSPGPCASRGCRCSGLAAADTLIHLARDLRYPDVSGAVPPPVRRGQGQRPVGGREAGPLGRRPWPAAEEELAETTLPTKAPAPRAPIHVRRRGHWRAGRMGPSVPVLHPGTRRPDQRVRHPRPRGVGAPGGLPQCGPPERHLAGPDGRRPSGRFLRGSVFLVAIQVEALDRARLLSDVAKALSDQHVNILSATVTTSRDRVAVSRFTLPRWATPSTSATSCAPSVRSTASTTSTASPANPRGLRG